MDPMGNESPYLGGPHLPIPYLFGTFGSQASFFSRVTIDLWFQIYRKLEDEGGVFFCKNIFSMFLPRKSLHRLSRCPLGSGKSLIHGSSKRPAALFGRLDFPGFSFVVILKISSKQMFKRWKYLKDHPICLYLTRCFFRRWAG